MNKKNKIFINYVHIVLEMPEKILSITRIKNDNVKKAVFDSLNSINASSLLRKKNMKILLKPNVLMGRKPERAVTTHPLVLQAVIQWVKQFNPSKIYVCDSSGSNQGVKEKTTEFALEKSGLKEICEKENVICIPFENTQTKKYKIKNSLVLNEIISSEILEEVDLIINIPKIKTHAFTGLTGSIKNMYGTVLEEQKIGYHRKFTSEDKFTSALVDVYSVSKPELTIIDGYLCQEGNGPSAGKVVKLDLILAGYDPVALDTLICKITGYNPKEILYIDKAERQGLGSSNLNDFTIKGEKIKDARRKFKKPYNFFIKKIAKTGFLKKIMNRFFRFSVVFDKNKCRLCGTCWNICPGNALSPPNNKKTPKWDKNKCITCFCCSELCPYEAVELKIKLFRNLLLPITAFALIILIILFLIIL